MEKEKKVICSVCQTVFSTVYNLRKHVKKFHSDEANILVPTKSYNFNCQDCSRRFTHLRHLKYHRRQKHADSHDSIPKKMKCPLCSYCGCQTSELLDHFTQVHNIEMTFSTHNFVSFEDFDSWKVNVENDSKSHFVKRRGAFLIDSVQTHEYACHRSGNFNSKSRGLRKLKNKGSNKIDGFCPASIKVTVEKNGASKVNYLATHVGHEHDLGHIFLNPCEREALASKIAQKISFNDILSEVRSSLHNSQLERIHLVTRKDLHNIKRCFNLESVCHKSETVQYRSDDEVKGELIITTDCKSPVEDSADNLQRNSMVEEIYIYKSTSLAEEKEKLKDNIIKLINAISNVEEVEYMKKVMLDVSSTFKK